MDLNYLIENLSTIYCLLVEQHRVEVYKNPNLGFSIAGGVGSSSNPFHPNDNKVCESTAFSSQAASKLSWGWGWGYLFLSPLPLREPT